MTGPTLLDPLPDGLAHADHSSSLTRTSGTRGAYPPAPASPAPRHRRSPHSHRARLGRASRVESIDRLVAAGPVARPLLRLRAAQLGPDRSPTCGPGTSATASDGLAVIGVHSPRFPFTQDHRRGRRGRRAARDRLAGGRGPGVRALEGVRAARLAGALPLGTGRRAALVPPRRGRLRRHRGGDPRGAAGERTARRPASAAGAPPALRRAGRRGDRSRRPSSFPGGSDRGAVVERGGTTGRSSSNTRQAAPTRPPTARARIADHASMATSADRRSRSPTRACTS